MAVGVRTIIALPAARTLVAFCALVSFVYGTDTVLFVGVSEHRLAPGPRVSATCSPGSASAAF